jgi:hypothetical protein
MFEWIKEARHKFLNWWNPVRIVKYDHQNWLYLFTDSNEKITGAEVIQCDLQGNATKKIRFTPCELWEFIQNKILDNREPYWSIVVEKDFSEKWKKLDAFERGDMYYKLQEQCYWSKFK